MSPSDRFCCKSRFAQGLKNSEGHRRGFRVKMRGASSPHVARTAGAPGFVFYMYMVSKADQLRPFIIYVIEENGAKVAGQVAAIMNPTLSWMSCGTPAIKLL